MPPLYMPRVSFQISTGLEVLVVEVQVEVVGLDERQTDYAWGGGGVFAEGVVDVLGLEGDAVFEVVGVGLG